MSNKRGNIVKIDISCLDRVLREDIMCFYEKYENLVVIGHYYNCYGILKL